VIVLLLVALALALPAVREASAHHGAARGVTVKHAPRSPSPAARAADAAVSVPAAATPRLSGALAVEREVPYDNPLHDAPFVPPRT
jgi:hypothetical protein